MDKKTRIVIADDNANIRITLMDILIESGYEVSAVGDGYELLAYLKKNESDIVILDLMMPEKSGIEVFESIRCMHPRLKVVIYTAFHRYADTSYVRFADKFVLKDFPVQKLLEALKELNF